MKHKKCFVFYFHFVDWDCISLGGHICFGGPNIEIHLPFGFLRVGWMRDYRKGTRAIKPVGHCRTFGLNHDH